MSYIQKYQYSEFPTIYCTELVVKPRTTVLKWNPARKDSDITVMGSLDTIKSNIIGKYRGILGNKVFILGSESRKWYFDVYETVEMYVGMAASDHDINSIDALVSLYIKAVQSDRIIFTLTTTELIIQHMIISGKVRRTAIYPLTDLMNQQACIWACTTKEDTMSLKLMEYQEFKISMDSSGVVRMNGSNNDIVDFNIDDINNNSGTSTGTFSGSVITLNSDGHSGIEVKLDDEKSRQLMYIESRDRWETGAYLGNSGFTVVEETGKDQTQGSIPGYDENGRLSGQYGLSSDEVQQMHTIYNAGIQDTSWPYINNLDQNIGTDSIVTFNNVKKSISSTLTSDTVLSNYINIFDTTLDTITATLPDLVTNKGIEYVIILKKYGPGNPLTITANGEDKIEGRASIDIRGDYSHVSILAADEWIIV